MTMKHDILRFIAVKTLVVIETQILGGLKMTEEQENIAYISKDDIELFEPIEYKKHGVQDSISYTNVVMKSGRKLLVTMPVVDFIKEL